MNDKQKKGAQIIDEIHGLLHTEERRNQGEVTYLGIARMTGRIGEHFVEGLPPQIQSAITQALSICSERGIAASNNKKLTAGLALAAIGSFLSVLLTFA